MVHQDGSPLMGSLDVDSLFTNIPVYETTDISNNTIYSQQDEMQYDLQSTR